MSQCIIQSNGTKKWYKNGKLHREGGPAIEHLDGENHWYINGKLHRMDGPACNYHDNKQWRKDGHLHREDGPAIEWLNGHKEWWLNGKILDRNSINNSILIKRYPALINAMIIHLVHSS